MDPNEKKSQSPPLDNQPVAQTPYTPDPQAPAPFSPLKTTGGGFQSSPTQLSKPRKPSPLFRAVKSFFSFVIFAVSVVIFAFIINLFVFQSYYVDGTSMEPTLEPNDRLIINKIPRTWAKITNDPYLPERGEVVVFDGPIFANGKQEQLIKRVIALPGEQISIKDGKVTVFNNEHPNGFNPDQSLNLKLGETSSDLQNADRLTVPQKEVYVIGDNRQPGGSYDSREFGTVPVDQVIGKLDIRILPLNEARFF